MVDFTRADCEHTDGVQHLNYDLAVKQGLDKERVLLIRDLQTARHHIYKAFQLMPKVDRNASNDPHRILHHAYLDLLTENEYALQVAWGFERDNGCHPHRGLHIDPRNYMH